MTDFDAWFTLLTGAATPHEWQRSLAVAQEPRSRLVRIPTGMGKTLGVVAAWGWHRLHRQDNAWPRRLVWCLPMRVLVEQTEVVVRDAFRRLGILWDGSADHAGKVGVHLLIGAADAGGHWNLFPEQSSVLIGTQDMLLSRALNRGYASGRARWPLEGQVVAELTSRGLPAAAVEILPWDDTTRELRHAVRVRRQPAKQPPVDAGFAVRLIFGTPISGPLALGYGAHFGLGLFVATDCGGGTALASTRLHDLSEIRP